MKSSSEACPISFEPKIDSTLLRVNSLFYIVVLSSAIFFKMPYLLLILIILFISKNINVQFECLLDIVNKNILKALHVKKKPIDPAPKKLANALGLVGSVIVFILFVFNNSLYIIPASVLGFAFFLEASLDYCIGCKIYAFIK